MKFEEAYEALKQGAKVKCPEWAGYWAWEDDSIKMHCKDGKILDIRESEDVDYTINFILRDDWEVVGDVELQNLDIKTFTFGEALRKLKAGKKVARQGWNGKGMFLLLGKDIEFNTKADLSKLNEEAVSTGQSIIMKTATNDFVVGWLASQTDMLAEDWVLVE